MQNLALSIGTEQQFNHSWELLRVLAGLFEIRKQSGRARLGDVSSTAASEERIFSVRSSRSSGTSAHHSTDHWHSTAGKKTTKTDFWGARSIFFLSGRVLVWAVLEKLVLAHTGAQKFSKGEPALAPLKSSGPSWCVWGGGALLKLTAAPHTTKKFIDLKTVIS